MQSSLVFWERQTLHTGHLQMFAPVSDIAHKILSSFLWTWLMCLANAAIASSKRTYFLAIRTLRWILMARDRNHCFSMDRQHTHQKAISAVGRNTGSPSLVALDTIWLALGKCHPWHVASDWTWTKFLCVWHLNSLQHKMYLLNVM